MRLQVGALQITDANRHLLHSGVSLNTRRAKTDICRMPLSLSLLLSYKRFSLSSAKTHCLNSSNVSATAESWVRPCCQGQDQRTRL